MQICAALWERPPFCRCKINLCSPLRLSYSVLLAQQLICHCSVKSNGVPQQADSASNSRFFCFCFSFKVPLQPTPLQPRQTTRTEINMENFQFCCNTAFSLNEATFRREQLFLNKSFLCSLKKKSTFTWTTLSTAVCMLGQESAV